MSDIKKLKIAAFLDGRPGHEKQTVGIISQIRKSIDTEIVNIDVRKPSFYRFLKLILGYIFPILSDIDSSVAACDVLIGTGTHTHLPMLIHKKKYGTPVVTCMTPAGFILRKFDLIFSPMHDNVTTSENIITTVGPPNSNENKRSHNTDEVLILVGGVDEKSHYWSTDELIEQVELILSREPEKSFTISTSPRTPSETSEKLLRLQKNNKNVQFFNFKDTPPGWVEDAYSKCKYVWVTGDSISMVYEALSSGCFVGIIPVHWKRKSGKFIRSQSFLKDSGYILQLEDYVSGKQDWQDTATLNEAKRCADILLKKLQ